LIRLSLVSAFLAESTQHIHSLRANGVISSQIASAFGLDLNADFKLIGRSWTTPPEMFSVWDMNTSGLPA